MPPRVVDLSDEEVAEARDLAEATYERYRSEPGHYRNLPRSHLLGKLGEVAAEKWLRSHGIDPDPAFRDANRDRDPDLIVSGTRNRGQDIAARHMAILGTLRDPGSAFDHRMEVGSDPVGHS